MSQQPVKVEETVTGLPTRDVRNMLNECVQPPDGRWALERTVEGFPQFSPQKQLFDEAKVKGQAMIDAEREELEGDGHDMNRTSKGLSFAYKTASTSIAAGS